jgi:hypothetical protein
MGSYATTTSLEILLPETTFDTATAALASKCITQSENIINSKLSNRYDVSDFNTSTSIPPAVTTYCEQLSMALMMKYRSRGSKEEIARAKEIYDPIIKELTMIAEYEADLVDSSGDPIAERTDGDYYVKSTTDTYTPIFDLDSETNWEVDPDLLDDIESDRG